MSDRPVLVLLHAFGMSARSWSAVQADLEGRFQIVALDLPGFGGAPDTLRASSVRDYGRWVVHEVVRRGIGGHVLVGWSMGGKIAMAAALQRPAGLRGLALVATSPPGPEPMTNKEREAERAAFDDPAAHRAQLHGAAAAAAAGDIDHGAEQRMAAGRAAWDFWLDVGSREDISQDVATLALPVLVVSGGEDDHLGRAEACEHVDPVFPQAAHRTIPGAGHLIPYEAPAALAEAIRMWVDKL